MTGEQSDELFLHQATCLDEPMYTLINLDHGLVVMPDDSRIVVRKDIRGKLSAL